MKQRVVIVNETPDATRGRLKLAITWRGRGCRVELDGVDITELVRGVDVHAHVKDVTTVTLELLPSRVEIEGDADVIVRPYVPQTYRRGDECPTS